MNSIEAMHQEIESQSSRLTSLRLPRMKGVKDCIFVGNGDSFVAGLISSYVSGFRSLSLTPHDIITFPQIAKGRHVFFVSVSGNTTVMALLWHYCDGTTVRTFVQQMQ